MSRTPWISAPVLLQNGLLPWRRAFNLHRWSCPTIVREKRLTPPVLRMQAQTAAAAAETSALEAAKHARMSHCIQALTAAQAAAQSFNLVCHPMYVVEYPHAHAGLSMGAISLTLQCLLSLLQAGIAVPEYADKAAHIRRLEMECMIDITGG